MKRRELLIAAAGLAGLASVGGSEVLKTISTEEFLFDQSNKLPHLWNKFFTASEQLASQSTMIDTLSFSIVSMVSALRFHARSAGPFQRASQLQLAETLQLASLLEVHQTNYGRAMSAAQEAEKIAYAHRSADLQAASILRQAFVLYYQGKSHARLHQYKRAALLMPYMHSELIKSRIQIGLAEAAASSSASDNSNHHTILDTAIATHPARPQSDPGFPYTYFGSHLSINVARYHIAAGSYHAALDALGTDGPIIHGDTADAAEAQSVLSEALYYLDHDACIDASIGLLAKSEHLGSDLRRAQAMDMFECLSSAPGNHSKKLAMFGEMLQA